MLNGIHHIGFRVENLKDSIRFFSSLGFVLKNQFEKIDENAKAAFLRLGGDAIEIWELDTKNSDFNKVIKKHLAFESENIEEDLKSFLNNGYSIEIPLTTGVTVRRYAYLKDSKNNYIEILEV